MDSHPMENFAALGFSSSHHVFFLLLLTPALLICFLAALILLRKARSRPPSRFPPGPRPFPIIGHLHLLGASPHQSLYNLSKVYGPLMSLKLGSVNVIVASTASTAKQILQTYDRSFCGRAPSVAAYHLHRCVDITFCPPNPYWRLMRQLCMTDLVGSKRLQAFSPLIEEEVGILLRSILHDNLEAGVTLRAKLYQTTNDIIFRMVLGKRLSEASNHSQNNFLKIFYEAINLLCVGNLSDFLPWLAWMDVQGCARRMKIIALKLSSLLQEILDSRRNFGREGKIEPSHKDFLDALLLSAASPNSGRKDIEVTDENIKAVLMDVFSGGTDTSVTTIEWAFAEMLANPMKLKALQEELEKVVGTSRLVEVSDIPNLPYLQAVVKETFRMHPVFPMLFPHMSIELCEMDGYEIPPNTQAYVNVWAIGRDPNTWERPLEFLPERFLNSNVDVNGQHFGLIPFGSGRRACPGWMTGLRVVHLTLASLVHSFDWTLLEKVDLSEKFDLVVSLATPLVAKATPRLPRQFFESSFKVTKAVF